MSIAGDLLTDGVALLVATHSMETVTIAGTGYSAFVMESIPATDFDFGGFNSQDFHRVAIPRSLISTIPSEGDAITFRSTVYRIMRVERDDAESPILLEFGPTTSKAQS